MKKYPLAISFLEKALNLQPDFENAIRLRSSLFEKLGKKNESRTFLASRSQSSGHGRWYTKAEIYIKNGRYYEALRYYDKAIEERKNWALPLREKGVTLIQLGHYDEAVVCLSEANKIKPNHEFTLNCLAAALINGKRFEQSLKFCDNALLLNSHNFKPWYNKGSALQRVGNHEESIKCLLEALKLNPKDVRIITNLIESYKEMGNYSEALKFCDETLKINPNIQYALKEKNDLVKKIAKLNENKPNIEIIKKLLVDMSTKYSRIHINEILEKTKYSNKRLIQEIILEMIKNQEIDAKYFKSSKFVVFEVAPRTKEIDEFMATYKDKDDKKL